MTGSTSTIAGRLESVANNRWHWAKKAKYMKQWRTTTAQAALVDRLPKAEGRRVSLTLTRYGLRVLDAGNLAASFKPVEDGLKDAGVIVDDSPKWVEVSFKQMLCKRGEERVTVAVAWLDLQNGLGR